MKKIRFLNLHIKWSFSINRYKRLTFELPIWADDVYIIKVDNNFKIKYYKGSEKFFIDLPKCNHAEEIYLTPRTYKFNGDRLYSTYREIIVEIFY